MGESGRAVSSIAAWPRESLSNVVSAVTKACPWQRERCGLHFLLESGQVHEEHVRTCYYSHFGRLQSAIASWIPGNRIQVYPPVPVTTNQITSLPNTLPNTGRQAALCLLTRLVVGTKPCGQGYKAPHGSQQSIPHTRFIHPGLKRYIT